MRSGAACWQCQLHKLNWVVDFFWCCCLFVMTFVLQILYDTLFGLRFLGFSFDLNWKNCSIEVGQASFNLYKVCNFLFSCLGSYCFPRSALLTQCV